MWRVKKGKVKVEESRTSWSSRKEPVPHAALSANLNQVDVENSQHFFLFYSCYNKKKVLYRKCLSVYQGKTLVEINYRLCKNQSYLTG